MAGCWCLTSASGWRQARRSASRRWKRIREGRRRLLRPLRLYEIREKGKRTSVSGGFEKAKGEGRREGDGQRVSSLTSSGPYKSRLSVVGAAGQSDSVHYRSRQELCYLGPGLPSSGSGGLVELARKGRRDEGAVRARTRIRALSCLRTRVESAQQPVPSARC